MRAPEERARSHKREVVFILSISTAESESGKASGERRPHVMLCVCLI
jgi:hypothetical protein